MDDKSSSDHQLFEQKEFCVYWREAAATPVQWGRWDGSVILQWMEKIVHLAK